MLTIINLFMLTNMNNREYICNCENNLHFVRSSGIVCAANAGTGCGSSVCKFELCGTVFVYFIQMSVLV